MPIGLVLLFAAAILIYFGLAHRVLDRMRLTDTQALLFLGLMLVGSFVELPIVRGESAVSVNVGGALVPLALVVYLISKAGTAKERMRAILASAVTAASIWLISRLTIFEPAQSDFIDPVWLFAIIAGLVGYLSGRSRRSAFIAGTMGVILADIAHAIQASVMGMRSQTAIGGAGVFDAVVMGGFIAVLLAELLGETRERLQGGPDTRRQTPEALREDEGVAEGNGADDSHEGERE